MTDATRRRVLRTLGSGAAAALAGCGGDGGGSDITASGTATDTPTETATATPTGSARLRVAHCSPDAPDVDIYVDGSAFVDGVAFGTVSDYLDISAGEHRLRVTPAGQSGNPLVETTATLTGDAAYTVAAVGEVSDGADRPFTLRTLADDNSAPASDRARLRLLHAAPDAPAIDVTLAATGDAFFDGVTYGTADALTVPAGNHTLQVRRATEDDEGEVLTEVRVSVDGGEVYTAVTAGYLTPGDESDDTPFGLFVARDTQGGMLDLTEDGRLRVAHLVPDASAVDVAVDGRIVAEGVAVGTIGDYVEVSVGARTVTLTATGESETLIEGVVTIDAADDYTVAAVGEASEGADHPVAFRVLEDANTNPDAELTRLRLVHAAPDAPALDVTLGESTLVDGVAFGESGGYATVVAGDHPLDVRREAEDDDGEVVASVDADLAGGSVYTGFVTGYLTPDDEPASTPLGMLVRRDSGGD